MLHQLFTAEFWAVLAGCWSVLSTFAAYRMRRWLSVHLERERQLDIVRTAKEIERHNETLRILSQASEPAVRPTLESMLADEKADFSLMSSETPSELVPSNWDDDNDVTDTIPETPIAKTSTPSSKWMPMPRGHRRNQDSEPPEG